MQGLISTPKLTPTDVSSLKAVRQSHFTTTPLMRVNATTISAAGKSNFGDIKRSVKPVHAASLGRPSQPKMQFQSFKSDHLEVTAMDLNSSMKISAHTQRTENLNTMQNTANTNSGQRFQEN